MPVKHPKLLPKLGTIEDKNMRQFKKKNCYVQIDVVNFIILHEIFYFIYIIYIILLLIIYSFFHSILFLIINNHHHHNVVY